MEININQKDISIGDKYQIYVDGKLAYSAKSKLFEMLPVIYILKAEVSVPVLTISKQANLLKTKYDISYPGNNTIFFQSRSMWHNEFECKADAGTYDIYFHIGRKYSIYKDSVQIAWFEKAAISWFKGDNYKIIADNNSDVELLISFCIIMDNIHSNRDNDNTVINIDLGYIGLETKKFDKDWRPNP